MLIDLLESSKAIGLCPMGMNNIWSLKGGCTGSSVSTLVKCHIEGNHISWLIYFLESE